jgi:hypothetical protein
VPCASAAREAGRPKRKCVFASDLSIEIAKPRNRGGRLGIIGLQDREHSTDSERKEFRRDAHETSGEWRKAVAGQALAAALAGLYIISRRILARRGRPGRLRAHNWRNCGLLVLSEDGGVQVEASNAMRDTGLLSAIFSCAAGVENHRQSLCARVSVSELRHSLQQKAEHDQPEAELLPPWRRRFLSYMAVIIGAFM